MLALTYLLLPQLVAAASLRSWGSPSAHGAAYFLDNSPAGSSIIALKISQDGKLSDPMRTSTGGKGLYALGASADGGPPASVGDGMLSMTAF